MCLHVSAYCRERAERQECVRACPTRDQALVPKPREKEETQKRQTHDDSLCHGCESVWIVTISGSERRRQKLEVGSFEFVADGGVSVRLIGKKCESCFKRHLFTAIKCTC